MYPVYLLAMETILGKSKIVVEPYTNSLGQVLQPGDEVVAVATSTGNTYIYKGKYLGVYKGRAYNYDTRKYEEGGITALAVSKPKTGYRRLTEEEFAAKKAAVPFKHYVTQYESYTYNGPQAFWNKNVFKLDSATEQMLDIAKKVGLA